MSIVSFHCVPRIVQLCYIFVVRGRTDFEHLEIFVNKPVRYWQYTCRFLKHIVILNSFIRNLVYTFLVTIIIR